MIACAPPGGQHVTTALAALGLPSPRRRAGADSDLRAAAARTPGNLGTPVTAQPDEARPR